LFHFNQKEEIKSCEERVKNLLEMIPPKGKEFLQSIEHILEREKNWVCILLHYASLTFQYRNSNSLTPSSHPSVCILKRFGGREMDVQHLKNNLLKRRKQIKLLAENGMVLAFFRQFNIFYTISGLLVMIYISG
jgi:hypothetical protein